MVLLSRPNTNTQTNTLNLEMFANTYIDFTTKTSLAPLLGFSKRVLEADKWQELDLQDHCTTAHTDFIMSHY